MQNYPITTLLVGFGAGLAVGAAVGAALAPASHAEQRGLASRIGQQLLDSINTVIPESLAERLRS